jgi:hypothetical protein
MDFYGSYNPGSVRNAMEYPMRDADHYLREANLLLSMSLGSSNPVVAAQLWEIAQDYLAKAVKLRVDSGLSALPRSPGLQARPRGARF